MIYYLCYDGFCLGEFATFADAYEAMLTYKGQAGLIITTSPTKWW